jgi:polyribonucleotide nucleotidyltransferase
MYHKNHGRFTTTDPILMKKDRQLDPQRLNLYAYVRNNPLVFTDETGLDLTFELKFDKNPKKASNLGDAKKYVKTLEKATGLKLNLDKTTGKITIKEEPKTLGNPATKIKTIIEDTSASINIAVSNKDANVLIGQYNGNGKQTLDFDDIKKVSNNKGGITKESVVVHETTEAYEGLKNGNNFPAAHSIAIDNENEVRASQGLSPRVAANDTLSPIDTVNQTQTITFDFTTHIQEVTVKTNSGNITGDIVKSKVRKKP